MLKRAWMMAAVVLCLSSAARADAARVLVVVETPHGARVGAAVRRGLSVQLPEQVSIAQPGESADVVITVAAGEGGLAIVRYWDTHGRTDTLSFPLPSPSARFEDVASTLAAVLLQRNLPSMGDAAGPKTEAALDALLAETTHQLPRSRVRRPRTFPLDLADFQ